MINLTNLMNDLDSEINNIISPQIPSGEGMKRK